PRAALSVLDRPAIAVLPFTNMSGEVEQEYFSDGISEDIITALSKLRWFYVIARNSSFIYKGKSVHLKQVGQELGVNYVVEGSVRKDGDRVRITVQLNDVATGSHLWAERYDRGLADVFAVQAEITQAIVAAIEPQLYAAESVRCALAAIHADSEDPWAHFALAGVYLLNRRFEDCLAEFELTLRLNPNFSIGHGYYGVALAYCGRWQEGDRAAQHALRLSPRDPFAAIYFG